MNKTDVDFTKIPDTPGVYRFIGKKKEILYVGKATSLRDRIRSYFANGLAEIRSSLIAKVVHDAVSISWEKTDSVLDALILESKRIREFRPVGNTDQKDDKSFAYLVVTKEKFPRFLVFRERELSVKAPRTLRKALYGPFMSAAQLKAALKIIRRIFPFFDTPFPLDENMSSANEKMLRFNQAISLYPKELNERAYRKSVRNIMLLFDAKKKSLLRTLEKDMVRAARAERFEEAHQLKRQLFTLRHIQDMTLIKDELRAPNSASFRVEAYDTAHIRGDAPRGVMSVVVDGEAHPSEYRTFTIRTANAGDDYQALEEIIRRRAKHREWTFPQLIVIDGGRAHLSRAKKVLEDVGMAEADVVAVVKDEKHRPREILGAGTSKHIHESSILIANAEAHRFAIGRHRKALRKRLPLG